MCVYFLEYIILNIIREYFKVYYIEYYIEYNLIIHIKNIELIVNSNFILL